MSKIYTKTGDKGQTSLFNGTRVFKNNIRVETYGTIDELNSMLGLVLAEVRSTRYEVRIKKEMLLIQNDLFEIGSMLANPTINHEPSTMNYFNNRILKFEKLIDELTEKLPILTNFILPGGGKVAALLHVARSVARRCERRIITLDKKENVDGVIIRYFNRLSDLLFTMSRFVNFKEKKKETIWTKK